MKKKVQIIVANPAGNITIFVKTPFKREAYAGVANQLLDMEELKGEQVAFILGYDEKGMPTEKKIPESALSGNALKPLGKMEMCGLEFCGNASRSFALITADNLGKEGRCVIPVDVSGSDEILNVEIDTETSYTRIKMPQPVRFLDLDLSGFDIKEFSDGTADPSHVRAVDFGGILHVILPDTEATAENFNIIKDYVNERFDPPAVGVMFFDTEKGTLAPVVYVRDVDTTYFEGSCGSGTTACCCAFGLRDGEGEHHYVIPQPAGTIETSCTVKRNSEGELYVESVFIEGPVELSEDITVEVETDNE